MTQVTKGVYFIKGQDDMIPDANVYIIGTECKDTSSGSQQDYDECAGGVHKRNC